MIDTDKMREEYGNCPTRLQCEEYEVEVPASCTDLRCSACRTDALCDEVKRLRHMRDDLLRERKWPWRPIETAPRDGTRVLIARDTILHGRLVSEAWWRQPWDGAPDTACWWDYDGGKTAFDMYVHGIGATHWQPLPEAPSDEN